VFLTGSVNSPAKKSLVEQIVEGVSGVQAIQNDIDFAPAGIRPDAQIEEEIKSRLKYDALVDASFIDVNVEDGHVTLAGRVSNAAQKRLAVQDAWVGGVKSVDAEKLRVSHLLREQPPVRRQVELPSDEAIERAAAISLTQDPRVPADAVAVDVANGAVTLSGQVASLATKRAIEQDISNIVGVSRVNNKLEVVSPSLSDSAIEERIREAFGRNPYLARADLVVSVTEGRVVLSGIAEHSYQISEAEELASRVRGVRQVENKIHLQESFG
jgi:osmotically-inducible protein OsmY